MSKLSLPAGRRQLGPGHLRFFRAAVEGVDLRRAWDYVALDEDDFSPALARATVLWIRETLIAECLSSGHPELIGLFRRDPALVADSGRPTIEAFAARFEHADAFSESELLELYQEEFGVSRAEGRRSRLQARMRQALDLLGRAVRRAPLASDPTAQWLAPHLAAHLAAVGLQHLGAVRAALDMRKSPRWEEVPGIGERWADRLDQWMGQHAIAAVAAALPARFQAPAVPAAEPGLRALPRHADHGSLALADCVLPARPAPDQAAAAGAWAAYPAERNRLGANDDRHAIALWLDARAGSNDHTRRAYSRMAERLYLWCQLERRCGLADLRVQDCIHYRTWLSDMGRKSAQEWAQAGWRIPAQQWMGKRVARRDSPEWRPFEKPLAKSSVAQELTVLRSFFSFLDRGGVVDGNPWELMGAKNFSAPFAARERQYIGRSLSMAQWKHLVEGLRAGSSEFESRLLLILWLGFGCGLRSAEIAALRFSNLRISQERWHLDFMGKGGKWRSVGLSEPVRQALLGYLATVGFGLQQVIEAACGLHPEQADAPLLRSQKGRRKAGRTAPSSPLGYSTLFRVLKTHFKSRAMAMEARDPVAAQQLRTASGHWLRHSFATQALQAGMPIDVVQKALGHASVATTGRYLGTEARRMDEEMDRFSQTLV